MIARLLGIPPEDLTVFKQMSDDLTATYNEPDPAVSAAPRAAFDAYFSGIIAARRDALDAAGIPRPGPEQVGTVIPDDLISSFIVADVDGRRLDRPRAAMDAAVAPPRGQRDQHRAVDQPGVAAARGPRPAGTRSGRTRPSFDVAVEESLRHDPPVLGLFRTPTRDVAVHGVTIPEKAKVMVCFGSANHDEAVFTEPGDYRLDRDPDETKRHLSFGFGAHYCPGAALARLGGPHHAAPPHRAASRSPPDGTPGADRAVQPLGTVLAAGVLVSASPAMFAGTPRRGVTFFTGNTRKLVSDLRSLHP